MRLGVLPERLSSLCGRRHLMQDSRALQISCDNSFMSNLYIKIAGRGDCKQDDPPHSSGWPGTNVSRQGVYGKQQIDEWRIKLFYPRTLLPLLFTILLAPYGYNCTEVESSCFSPYGRCVHLNRRIASNLVIKIAQLLPTKY